MDGAPYYKEHTKLCRKWIIPPSVDISMISQWYQLWYLALIQLTERCLLKFGGGPVNNWVEFTRNTIIETKRTKRMGPIKIQIHNMNHYWRWKPLIWFINNSKLDNFSICQLVFLLHFQVEPDTFHKLMDQKKQVCYLSSPLHKLT